MKQFDRQQRALDNLQFIADRIKDGKKFIRSGKVKPLYYFDTETKKLMQDRIYRYENSFGDGIFRAVSSNPVTADDLTIADLMLTQLELQPDLFSQDELVIIKSLKLVNWLVRNEYGNLIGYINEPRRVKSTTKGINYEWRSRDISLSNDMISLTLFNHMFHAIEWDDAQPTFIGNLK